jgi:hypothetical protein
MAVGQRVPHGRWLLDRRERIRCSLLMTFRVLPMHGHKRIEQFLGAGHALPRALTQTLIDVFGKRA